MKLGKYRHYKGNFYEVLMTARHSETEEPYVVYRCLYGDFSVWVRPAAMFTDSVILNGREVPRFAWCGDEVKRPCVDIGRKRDRM